MKPLLHLSSTLILHAHTHETTLSAQWEQERLAASLMVRCLMVGWCSGDTQSIGIVSLSHEISTSMVVNFLVKFE
jgi:cytosine/adenosine deaminase-related metal-dependent hydrolase